MLIYLWRKLNHHGDGIGISSPAPASRIKLLYLIATPQPIRIPFAHYLPPFHHLEYLSTLAHKLDMPSSKGKPTDPELREKIKEGKSRRTFTQPAARI